MRGQREFRQHYSFESSVICFSYDIGRIVDLNGAIYLHLKKAFNIESNKYCRFSLPNPYRGT